MKTQRIQTIERRLLIAFQTKRKELLFRFSVSSPYYVTVNTHPSTFPVPLFLTLPFHILCPTYLSAHRSRASLSFSFSLSISSLSSSFFLILSRCISRVMKVSASTWRREWNLLFRVRIRKRKNRDSKQ